jgi:hypothetical protein
VDGSAQLFGRASAPSFSAGRFILIGCFVFPPPWTIEELNDALLRRDTKVTIPALLL